MMHLAVRPCVSPATQSPSQPGRPARDCRGFTLVELLVVIAIIAILIALLMPAIQAAREAARRAQCMSNQKQVALAILAYESAQGRLPPSGVVEQNEDPNLAFGTFDLKRGKMFSWAVLILPQLEEQALFDQFDLERTVLDQPRQPQAQHVSAYMCPSDGAEDRYYVHPEHTQGVRFAKANYAAYVSPYHVDEQVWYPGALGGVRWSEDQQSTVGQKLTAIRDGMSKTIMISEVLTRRQELDQRGAWALPWNGTSLLAFDVHPIPVLIGRSQIRAERTLPYSPWRATLEGAQRPNNRGFNVDMLYDCSDPDGAQLEGLPCEQWDPQQGPSHYLSAAPRSRHGGGVVAAAVDGHVRFLTDDIDPIVMAFMVCINDGKSRDIPD